MHNQLSAPHPPGWNQIRGGSHNALGTSRVRGEGRVLRETGWREPFFRIFSSVRFAFLVGRRTNMYILLNHCHKFDALGALWQLALLDCDNV